MIVIRVVKCAREVRTTCALNVSMGSFCLAQSVTCRVQQTTTIGMGLILMMEYAPSANSIA